LYVGQCGACPVVFNLGPSSARHGDLDQIWS
jgi:hypothetical protein